MWNVVYLDSVDSTNDECKRRAAAGAPQGLAVIAGTQTAGRGRRGRSFQSLPDKGLYLSVLLRPTQDLETVASLTAWTAVAVCEAVEQACGLSPAIKWPNDVLLDGKKLCGILTEAGPGWVVVGMGLNLTQTAADFGPALAGIATSLALQGAAADRDVCAAALLDALGRMVNAFPRGRDAYLAQYRRRCVTLGREVALMEPGGPRSAYALDVDPAFALLVRAPGGGEERITFGEVSVRGLLGYGM